MARFSDTLDDFNRLNRRKAGINESGRPSERRENRRRYGRKEGRDGRGYRLGEDRPGDIFSRADSRMDRMFGRSQNRFAQRQYELDRMFGVTPGFPPDLPGTPRRRDYGGGTTVINQQQAQDESPMRRERRITGFRQGKPVYSDAPKIVGFSKGKPIYREYENE